MAKAFAADTGAEFISPYSDADVIAGAATIALEIFEDAPDHDVLLVPIGGGGLISGVALAANAIAPACEVIGVEARRRRARFRPASAPARSSRSSRRRRWPTASAATPIPTRSPSASSSGLVDRIDTVSEDDLAAAIAGLVEHEHLVAEGAGAAATAALVGRRIGCARDADVAAVVSGINIDRSAARRAARQRERDHALRRQRATKQRQLAPASVRRTNADARARPRCRPRTRVSSELSPPHVAGRAATGLPSIARSSRPARRRLVALVEALGERLR